MFKIPRWVLILTFAGMLVFGAAIWMKALAFTIEVHYRAPKDIPSIAAVMAAARDARTNIESKLDARKPAAGLSPFETLGEAAALTHVATKAKTAAKAAAGAKPAAVATGGAVSVPAAIGAATPAAAKLETSATPRKLDRPAIDAACKAGGAASPPPAVCLASLHANAAGAVTISAADKGLLDFGASWVSHVKQLGVTNLVFGALDATMLAGMAEAGVPAFQMPPCKGIPCASRFQPVEDLLKWGFDVFMCDVDSTWLRDPFPYFDRFPHADILISSDHLRNTAVRLGRSQAAEEALPAEPKPAAGSKWYTAEIAELITWAVAAQDPVADYGLENTADAGSSFNIGVMFVRSRPATLRLFVEANVKLTTALNVVDQSVFNELLRSKMFDGGVQRVAATEGTLPAEGSRLTWAFNRSIKMGVLPLVQFANGHSFFTQQYFRPAAAAPFLVHATFTTYGTAGKRHRLREFKLFADPPAYYAEGNFLVYNTTLPDGLGQLAFTGWGDTPAQHFAVVAFQTGLLRSALAMARLLDRTLVLPPLYCSCETFRYDRLEQCIHKGGALILPYLCPVDDLLNLENWVARGVAFRESTFLENPRTPAEVTASRLRVMVCAEGETEAACNVRITDAGVGEWIQAQAGMDAAAVVASFGAKTARVLDFSSMHGLFAGFGADVAKATEFDTLVKGLQGEFCCQRDDSVKHANVPYEPFAAWDAAGVAGQESALPSSVIKQRFAAVWTAQDKRTKSTTPMPIFPAESGPYAKRICELEGAAVHFGHLARKPFAACG